MVTVKRTVSTQLVSQYWSAKRTSSALPFFLRNASRSKKFVLTALRLLADRGRLRRVKYTMRVLILILVLWATPVCAEWRDWSRDTQALFVASNVAIVADWATTRYGVTHGFPNNTYETNPILGRYPSRDRVDLYMIGILVSNYYITDWLSPQYRGFYLTWRTIEHGTAAHGNVQLGWKMQF